MKKWLCLRGCLSLIIFRFSFCYDPLLKHYTLSQIDQSEIIEHPFPALIVDDFLPEEYYFKATQKFPNLDS